MSKIEIARESVRDHPGMSNRAIAKILGVSHMTVARARNMKDVPDVPVAQALEIILRAAESGELDRADVARIVAARWDLTGETWFHYMADGTLQRETPGKPANPRPRRTVRQRAE